MRPKSTKILSKYSDLPFGLRRRLVSGIRGRFLDKLINALFKNTEHFSEQELQSRYHNNADLIYRI